MTRTARLSLVKLLSTNELLSHFDIIMILSENGVTPSGVLLLSAEDFDDMGLTKVGKKLFLKTFEEIKGNT